MSFSRLLEIIHSATPLSDWTKANKEAFEGLLSDRYPKAAEKALKVRAPEMAPSGVSFAAYIPFNSPDSGAYGGLSFVIFPIPMDHASSDWLSGHKGSPMMRPFLDVRAMLEKLGPFAPG